MRYNLILPSALLKKYIDYFFVIEKEKGEADIPTEVFPSPHTGMVFTFGDALTTHIVHGKKPVELAIDHSISGFALEKSVYTNQNYLGVIMVGFKPWGAQPFLDFELDEFTNSKVDLNDLNRSKIRIIEDQIRTKKTDKERVGIIERFLAESLRPVREDSLIIDSVNRIFKNCGNETIYHMAKDYDLSQKQFTRRFVKSVGVNPKIFSRLVRFQRMIGLMDKKEFGLLDVAFESGLFDQSHFIREFQSFTNETPKEYLNRKCNTELCQYFERQSEMSIFYNYVFR